MSNEWELKKLGEVYDVRDGTHDSPKYHATGFPLITSKNLKQSGLSFEHTNFISEQDYIKINQRSAVHKGDVLFAMIGTIGNPTLVTDEPNFAIKNVALFKVPHYQSGSFLKHYLSSEFVISKMAQEAKGTTQKFVGLGYLRNFPIKVPSLSEQKRIAAILDEALDGIANAKSNAEKNLYNARELFESHLYNVIANAKEEGKIVSLSNLATDITDGDHMPPPKSETGVPFITIGNIQKKTREIDFSETLKVPHAYFESLKANKKPKSGDVLYTVTGSFGIPVLVKNDFEFCFQRHIGLIRPKPEIDSEWLYYLLMSPQVFSQANEGATGTAQKTVSLKLLRGFQVPLIPLSQQRADVEKLNAMAKETQRLESIYQQKLAALDELKQSLLHQAFSGNL